MPRSGYQLTMTPAKFREHARTHIRRFDVRDRQRARADFLAELITSTETRYSLAQMRAAVRGLDQGITEGIR